MQHTLVTVTQNHRLLFGQHPEEIDLPMYEFVEMYFEYEHGTVTVFVHREASIVRIENLASTLATALHLGSEIRY